MNTVDYDLGFARATGSEESWNGADGVGAAKASLFTCKRVCELKHPLPTRKGKEKQKQCKQKCLDTYNAKMLSISASKGERDAAYGASYEASSNQQSGDQSSDSTLVDNVGQSTSDQSGMGAKKMSTGVKIGIAIGVVAVIIGAVVIIKRRK